MSDEPFDARQTRAQMLRGFLRLADAILADRAVRSVHLGCSQYYCDEAGDAVHSSITASASWLPSDEEVSDAHTRTPYELRWQHMAWDENGAAVYAFAPLCNEEGWTDREEMDDYGEGGTVSPVASVHRLDDGSLRAAWLGALHRPWLDFHGANDRDDDGEDESESVEFVEDPLPAPLEGREVALHAQALAEPANLGIRDVLADVWLLRDDPRGHFAAACRAGDRKRAADLVLAHGRSWLGLLGPVIPLGGALFGHGPFVDKAIVFGDEETLARLAYQPAWATIRAIEFAPESAVVIAPAMTGLRAVGPIDHGHLPLLAGHAIEELDLRCDGALGPLPRLPHLRTLIVRAPGAVAIPALPALSRVELWLPGSADAITVREAFRGTTVPAGCTLAVGILHGHQRTGLLYTGDRIVVHRPDARYAQAAAWADALEAPLPATWEPAGDDWLAFGLGVA